MGEKPPVLNNNEILTFKPYFDNSNYQSMLAFLNQGGDSNEILKIVEQVSEENESWFSRDFFNRVGVWKEEILKQGKLSEGGKDFVFKTLDEFWSKLYKDGKPRVSIHFDERDSPNWEAPDTPRK